MLSPEDFLHLLMCPGCRRPLKTTTDKVLCSNCNREFTVSEESILELIHPEELDAETKRELEGNTVNLSPDQARLSVMQENIKIWKQYYWRQRRYSIKRLAAYLKKIDIREAFFLATGRGRDIFFLSRYCQFDTLYCSDLSLTALHMVPYRLGSFHYRLGLFTSNLDQCPGVFEYLQ